MNHHPVNGLVQLGALTQFSNRLSRPRKRTTSLLISSRRSIQMFELRRGQGSENERSNVARQEIYLPYSMYHFRQPRKTRLLTRGSHRLPPQTPQSTRTTTCPRHLTIFRVTCQPTMSCLRARYPQLPREKKRSHSRRTTRWTSKLAMPVPLQPPASTSRAQNHQRGFLLQSRIPHQQALRPQGHSKPA